MPFDVTQHNLVPKHKKLSDTEKEKLFAKFNITNIELPKIALSDPAIEKLGVKIGDIIVVERESQTAGVTHYYRAVVEG
ncbi:MAG: DNA-directed RNA polymerase subunit H [Nanoarchaeota archaeon]|nr:DNA-directed RNA polymerase subunit H [Nanoarchaeota archaeon]MBU1622865.1 DNA-directed RNA polymerase subunit H [Nanoarchaeota archaeon]MBU1974619.1 DNA-directed RNA polymerase subunit H [Nanoarchaeota archaeon]